MSKVYVLEHTNLDVSSASKFGEIMYIFPDQSKRVSIWDSGFGRSVIRELEARDFNPVVDYFVIVGAMVPMALAVACLVSTHGPVNLLLFSSTERSYVLRKVGDNTHE